MPHLARDRSWRWPSDRVASGSGASSPPAPRISAPSPTSSSARHTSASLTPRLSSTPAGSRLARTLPVNTIGDWGMSAMWDRSRLTGTCKGGSVWGAHVAGLRLHTHTTPYQAHYQKATCTHLGGVDAVEGDDARLNAQQAEQRQQQRGLAAARAADLG